MELNFTGFINTAGDDYNTDIILTSSPTPTLAPLPFRRSLLDVNTVTFRLHSTPIPTTIFSQALASESCHVVKLIFNYSGPALIFNGIPLANNEVAIITSDSATPFALQAPAGAKWLSSSIKYQDFHLQLLAAGNMPIPVNPNVLTQLRTATKNYKEAQFSEPGLPGMHAVLDILAELHKAKSVLRPTNLVGRSKLARRILLPKAIHLLTDAEQSPTSTNEIAKTLNISNRTLNSMFSDIIGISPKQLQTQYKLVQLHKVLKSNRYETVASAMDSIGITEHARASSRYKSIFGHTPKYDLAP